MAPVLIRVDGNRGSGKSTLLQQLKLKYELKELLPEDHTQKIIFLQEPVDEWNTIQDHHGVSILQHFYNDQQKYAFSFQMMAYITRLKILMEAIEKYPDAIIIMERSLGTDKNIFAKMLYQDEKINEIEYKIYLKWFDEFTKNIPKLNIIYLRVKPTTCMQRIKMRNRTGEEGITLEYIEKCHTYHDDWIMEEEGNHSFQSFHLITDKMNDSGYYDSYLSSVCNLIKTISLSLQ